jgi:hypothetical protein
LGAPFRARLDEFTAEGARAILGQLISARSATGFASQYLKQIDAWQLELEILDHLCRKLRQRQSLYGAWSILLEYPIPRRQKYPDVVVLAEDVIFVVEMKVGAATFDSAARWQVEDYALDLRDFHVESANRTIIPVLVATAARPTQAVSLPSLSTSSPSVWPVSCVSPADLEPFIVAAFEKAHQAGQPAIDAQIWDRSPYRPSLSIVEAARELFAGHTVAEIAHAWADNLSRTTAALIDTVAQAQKQSVRTLCFVTGVPGSGKTLTGLNAIHHAPANGPGEAPGVFLSGNGPLVRIVREALVRDVVRQRRWPRNEARRNVGTFIQNVHAFLEEYFGRRTQEAPHEHVVVFDEAQRAWSADQVSAKKGVSVSEPSMMLQIMERCPGWCALVALVGGGQEIHRGEAGLEAWSAALSETKQPWNVFVSPEALAGGASLAGHRLLTTSLPSHCHLVKMPSLHLDVTVRSPRAQALTQWVNLVLQGESERAKVTLESSKEFPLVLTRDLQAARSWLRDRSRFERRCGLVASSGAGRLRAYGIEVSANFRRGYPFEEWFLALPGDVRSSDQLEVAATEFECQGLELDWVGVCWGDDLCFDPSRKGWRYRRFSGATWQTIRTELARRYLINKYRVLLTRARAGMVLWIPPGESCDPTRDPQLLNATATYLQASGVQVL